MLRLLPAGVEAHGYPLASPARADKVPNPLTDRFQVTLGTFFITSKPIVQLNGDAGSSDRVDWDSEFGGMDADRIRLDCHWRFADRHKLRATAFNVSRERSEVLDESIDWEGRRTLSRPGGRRIQLRSP